MNAHSYAVSIEHVLRDIMGFDDRGGFGGIIDADFIERNCFTSIACALGYFYANAISSRQNKIEKYINDFKFYLELGLHNLLKFKTNVEVIDGTTYELNFENGEAAIEAIIAELRSLKD